MCVAISMIEPCFLHRVIRIVMDSYGNRSLPTLCHVAHSRPIMRHYRRDNVNASLFLSQIGNGEDREYLGNQGTSRRGSRFGVSQLKSDRSCRFHDRKVVRRRPCKCYCFVNSSATSILGNGTTPRCLNFVLRIQNSKCVENARRETRAYVQG